MLNAQETTTEKQILQMEERQCANCSRTFRVLVKSPQTFCSQSCQIDSPIKKPEPKKLRPWETLERDQEKFGQGVKTIDPKTLQTPVKVVPKPIEYEIRTESPVPPTRETKPVETVKPVETPVVKAVEPKPEPKKETKKSEIEKIDARWSRYVAHAKTYVKFMNRGRMRIAELAIKACDIQWGGGNHWKGFKDVYTLKRFAQEIGVHQKTLSEWCAVKRLIVDKLPEGVFVETNYMAAQRTRKRVTRHSTRDKVTKVYLEELARNGDRYYFFQSLKRIGTTLHLVKRAKLKELDRSEVEAMRDVCREIDRVLTEFLTKSNS